MQVWSDIAVKDSGKGIVQALESTPADLEQRH